jgi:fibronectin type 3 domain-containing protein
VIVRRSLAFAGLGLLCSCGYPGGPLAPTLDMPAVATDFRAWESGDQIDVEFTVPALTTEGLKLKSVRSAELGVVESPAQVSAPSATHYPVPATVPGSVTFQIPARQWIGKTLTLAARATGPKGKTSEWSNPSVLAVIQPLAKPTKPKLDNVAQGVALTWTGSGPHYRVFRAEADGQPAQVTQVDVPTFVDATTSYGTSYRYYVQAIAEPNQWSDVSDPSEITPVDTFPPAVPSGLTALPSAQSIELSWSRNTESDFRGYNVFRSVDGGAAQKIESLLESPAFSDTKVEAGKKYKYTVSAVDASGNESAQSIPAEAML